MRVGLLTRLIRSQWLEWGCRYLLAVVFLLAAATKLLDLAAFADPLVLHPRLPYLVARVVGVFVPWLELTCGFCLLLNVARREAAVLVGILVLAFTGYVLTQPAGSDCHCFFFPQTLPVAKEPWWPVARNLFCLLCAVRVATWPADRSSEPRAPTPIE